MDFSTTWDKHKTHIFNFIQEKVSSIEVAEDLLQEVAIKFYDASKNGKVEKHKLYNNR